MIETSPFDRASGPLDHSGLDIEDFRRVYIAQRGRLIETSPFDRAPGPLDHSGLDVEDFRRVYVARRGRQ